MKDGMRTHEVAYQRHPGPFSVSYTEYRWLQEHRSEAVVWVEVDPDPKLFPVIENADALEDGVTHFFAEWVGPRNNGSLIACIRAVGNSGKSVSTFQARGPVMYRVMPKSCMTEDVQWISVEEWCRIVPNAGIIT